MTRSSSREWILSTQQGNSDFGANVVTTEMEQTLQQIQDWRGALAGDTYLSPSRVQERLFALWSEVRDTPAARLVERWLTLTIERELFSAAELVEFLDELEAYIGLHAESQRVTQG